MCVNSKSLLIRISLRFFEGVLGSGAGAYPVTRRVFVGTPPQLPQPRRRTGANWGSVYAVPWGSRVENGEYCIAQVDQGVICWFLLFFCFVNVRAMSLMLGIAGPVHDDACLLWWGRGLISTCAITSCHEQPSITHDEVR